MTDDEQTPADALADSLGQAAGRKLAIQDVEAYIEERGLTTVERYELALSILDDLNYDLLAELPTEPSRDAYNEEGEN